MTVTIFLIKDCGKKVNHDLSFHSLPDHLYNFKTSRQINYVSIMNKITNQRKQIQAKLYFVFGVFMFFFTCIKVNQPIDFAQTEKKSYIQKGTHYEVTHVINIEKIVTIDFVDSSNLGADSTRKPAVAIFFKSASSANFNNHFLNERNSNYILEIFISDTPFFSTDSINSHMLSRQIELVDGQRNILDTTYSSNSPFDLHSHIWGFIPSQLYTQSEYYFWQAQINFSDGSTMTMPPKLYGYPSENLRDCANKN